ncbi:MAG: hypothetical protein SPI15_04480, partial [Candidatus Faecousia sp.]|nr:hypothetical protein [Clostridiales bacterium]MDY6180090.1 hypothetical protein [Candidatus Faecousia sp.]
RIGEICFLPMQSGKTQHVWTYPNNLSSYGNKAVAVPHPPLRGTFPPGEGISASPQSFKQQFIGLRGLDGKQLSFRIEISMECGKPPPVPEGACFGANYMVN